MICLPRALKAAPCLAADLRLNYGLGVCVPAADRANWKILRRAWSSLAASLPSRLREGLWKIGGACWDGAGWGDVRVIW